MAWILSGTNLSVVVAVLAKASLPLVLAAFALNFVGYVLICSRWRLLLASHGTRVSLGYLFTSNMVAVFFNNLLPSTVGGDGVRAYDSWRAGAGKAVALTVILVDRVSGLLALLLFVGAALLFWPLVDIGALPIPAAAIGLIGAVVLVVAMVLLAAPTLIHAILRRVKHPFVRRFSDAAERAGSALTLLASSRRTLAKVLGLSLLLQTNVVIHYYIAAQALQLGVPLISFFLVVPLGVIVTMLPVTINGLGLREGAFTMLLAPFGVTRPEAVAFAWLIYGFILLQGVLGGLVYAGRRADRPAQNHPGAGRGVKSEAEI